MKTQFLSLLIVLGLTVSINAQNVGDPAPDFTLNQLSGGEFTLSDHSGKVVFLFFFGNTCPHCIANGPNTQTLIYEQHKDNENFVAVGIDTWDGNASVVESYKSSTGIQYPLLLNGSQVKNDYSTTYDRIIVIDQSGVIQFKASANATETVTLEANTVIENLFSTTSVNELINENKLWTNYNSNSLTFNNPYENSNLTQVNIINIVGQVAIRENINLQEKNSISLPALKSGIYFLSLNNNSEIKTTRFLVP